MTLFDSDGWAVTEEAICRAGENADESWQAAATVAVRDLALDRDSFTTDDFHALMAWRHPGLVTHDGRALGAVMRHAAKEGWCSASDQTTPSMRTVSHRRPVRVWVSQIWRGEP